ncbi:MAG TPA: glucosamine-6-phosphate deaminase [Pelobium sp.]|nr:glucosamine-6-phosphate deaminase [Pelobium sp.]
MIKEFKANNLDVKVYPTRAHMGIEAAELAAEKIKELLSEKDDLNIVFAAAPSQNEFLKALKLKANVDWNKINAFHMDEYIGLDKVAPQGFGNFLKARIFDELPFKSVHYLNGSTENADGECNRYAALLQQHPVDIVFMGIGENGHLAFNDPPVADFNDPKLVKIVELDEVCRQQQVNDGCFNSIEDVPLRALTLTLPCLISADYIFCMVPGPTKAQAVKNTVIQAIKEEYPSTILRTHPNAILFVDQDSGNLIYEHAE